MTEQIKKLLFCPFCGTNDDVVVSDSVEMGVTESRIKMQGGRFLVHCLNCGINTSGYSTEEKAISAFNTRYDLVDSIESAVSDAVRIALYDTGY